MSPNLPIIGSSSIEKTEKKEKHLISSNLCGKESYGILELNLPELPIFLLTSSNKGVTRIPLSEDGTEYIESHHPMGLPTSSARRSTHGALSLTGAVNGFKERVVRFEMRNLVEKYAYAGRFERYRAGGKLLKATFRDLCQVMNTRIISEKWWNHELKKKTSINTPIIEYIEVLDKGGRNSPCVIEMAWSTKVFNNVISQYTTSYNPKFLANVTHSLDEAMFFWLNKHLFLEAKKFSAKPAFISNCRNFARFKLGMRGVKLKKEGYTASRYAASRIGQSVERLIKIGLQVKMKEVEKEGRVIGFQFDAVGNRSLKTYVDLPRRIVLEFKKIFFGAIDEKSVFITENDQREAKKWLASYGLEKSVWMLQRCKDLHAQSKYSDRRIATFKGLEFYQNLAEADYEKLKNKQENKVQLEVMEVRKNRWYQYQKVMLDLALEEFGKEQLMLEAIEQVDEVSRRVVLESPTMPERAKQNFLQSQMRLLALSKMQTFNQEEFDSFKSDAELTNALQKRHGFNPLKYPKSMSAE